MLNKVIIMGRLTADPELRQTPSGISTCRFSVAVDRGYKSKDTGERQTDFIRVTAWRQTAEFVSRYFSKGKMIIVEGSLRNNDYTDANGVKHYSMDVQADNVSFGESKSASANASGIGNVSTVSYTHLSEIFDGLSFIRTISAASMAASEPAPMAIPCLLYTSRCV